MYNMIVKDEGEGVRQGLEFQGMDDRIQLSEQNLVTFKDFLQMHKRIRHREFMSRFGMIWLRICGLPMRQLKHVSE